MEENFDKETEVAFIVSILFSFWRCVIGSLYKKDVQQYSFQIRDVFVRYWLLFLIHIHDKTVEFLVNEASRCHEKMWLGFEDSLVILRGRRRILKERNGKFH